MLQPQRRAALALARRARPHELLEALVALKVAAQLVALQREPVTVQLELALVRGEVESVGLCVAALDGFAEALLDGKLLLQALHLLGGSGGRRLNRRC